MIVAIDYNTEINSNSTSSLLTIFINDINDNPPEFIADTLLTTRRVIEEAETNMFIGVIYARDIDGPEHNQFNFTLM